MTVSLTDDWYGGGSCIIHKNPEEYMKLDLNIGIVQLGSILQGLFISRATLDQGTLERKGPLKGTFNPSSLAVELQFELTTAKCFLENDDTITGTINFQGNEESSPVSGQIRLYRQPRNPPPIPPSANVTYEEARTPEVAPT